MVLSPLYNVEDIHVFVLWAPLCPSRTALHCVGEQLPPPLIPPPCLDVMGARIVLLDLMDLATEILEKTAGPTIVSQPHFLPQGLAGGHMIQA